MFWGLYPRILHITFFLKSGLRNPCFPSAHFACLSWNTFDFGLIHTRLPEQSLLWNSSDSLFICSVKWAWCHKMYKAYRWGQPFFNLFDWMMDWLSCMNFSHPWAWRAITFGKFCFQFSSWADPENPLQYNFNGKTFGRGDFDPVWMNEKSFEVTG